MGGPVTRCEICLEGEVFTALCERCWEDGESVDAEKAEEELARLRSALGVAEDALGSARKTLIRDMTAAELRGDAGSQLQVEEDAAVIVAVERALDEIRKTKEGV